MRRDMSAHETFESKLQKKIQVFYVELFTIICAFRFASTAAAKQT
jgi:hypothetical protein